LHLFKKGRLWKKTRKTELKGWKGKRKNNTGRGKRGNGKIGGGKKKLQM